MSDNSKKSAGKYWAFLTVILQFHSENIAIQEPECPNLKW